MNSVISIKKNAEFKSIYGSAHSIANKTLVLYYKATEDKTNRIGISVSKRVGNSVVRHRVKRLIKEAYRHNIDKIKKGYDFIVVARTESKDKDYKQIESSLIHLFKKVELYEKTNNKSDHILSKEYIAG